MHRYLLGWLVLFSCATAVQAAPASDSKPLVLHLQSREKAADGQEFVRSFRSTEWDPRKTAVIICDMWDHHHCQGAERRTAELAPRMNEVVKAARRQGVLIIHCPSGTMEAYKDAPGRKLAQQAKLDTKEPIAWCRLDPKHEAALPIDDSDGGCNCQPPCPTGQPWKKQISTIEIQPGDAISDSGAEVFGLFEKRGIENVVIMGVHTNMCVLGRPFGIRQLVRHGKHVVLARDLTDTMYNSRMAPKVDHFRGTELVIEHIEKYWCPTIVSTDLAGGVPFVFSEDKRPHVAIIADDNHYRPLTTLPGFAEGLQTELGYRLSVLPVDDGRIVNAGAMKSADLLVLFVRRKALPLAQLSLFHSHLDAGKPLVALRTASHAFAIQQSLPEGLGTWETFDDDVLGGNYHGHYPAKDTAKVEVAAAAAKNPLLAGIEPATWNAVGELYQVSPISEDATVLLTGSLPGKPHEPVAWQRNFNRARIFYTSLGHPDHFAQPQFRKLLANAISWTLKSGHAEEMTPYVRLKRKSSGEALPPEEAAAHLTTPADLEIEQVLAEPHVAQPVFMTFDERGRMWVVQYLQYPFPAGLKILSEDKFLRATYDKVPPAPPHHFRGNDKITIHEDTDGDGRYDKHKTFVDGLNIVSSVAPARGGLWVLNPPYLLFYPDRNHDDVPDGDPEVHLSGFGMEDTHSVVNSLQMGPDGWLYAAQGSTVSGDVVRPGIDGKPGKKPVHSLGQLIWRYHPESHRYEIFAEGGGNAFGLEIDSKGRIFSGHNGGDTRGFHYVQGGYYQKGFAKHGPLSNPYTFGYFAAMKHDKVPRFTHCTIIYEGGALPGTYTNKLMGVHPLMSHVVISQVDRDGSTFKTKDVGHAIDSTDQWFRPVDIKTGPDGAVYVADMYEGQIAHLLHHEGKIDRSNGRIYRIKAKGAATPKQTDLGQLKSSELIALLGNANKWQRREAIRLLGDRHEADLAPQLRTLLAKSNGQTALEALWAINAVGGLDDATAQSALKHADPYVRIWAVRLLGDRHEISTTLAADLAALAARETQVDVRSQLACTARRLPAAQALPIVKNLVRHDEDAQDIHLPLLVWWVIEAKADTDRPAVLALLQDSSLWDEPLVREHLLHRLMRRYAMAGTRKDLQTCAALLKLSPSDDHSKLLLRGFEEAYQGRAMTNLPDELVEAMARLGGQSLVFGLRQGKPEAVAKALKIIADPKADAGERLQYVQILGEARQPQATDVLARVAVDSSDDGLKMAALGALQGYDSPQLGGIVLAAYPGYTDDVRSVAQTLLASRKAWALALVAAVEAGKIDRSSLPLDVVRKLTVHREPGLAERVAKLWGHVDGATTADMREQIARLQKTLKAGTGTPYAGKKLFSATCAKCHRLFTDGGQIGPDLTSFKRDDVTNMLTNIVNPSAEVREGFETYVAVTGDGRVVSGFLADRDNRMIVLRGIDGQNVALEQDDLEQFERQKRSLMPEGLLQKMTDQQIRDLFAYLRSTQPLAN
jgi:putative heme-binding domain-containing protein